MRIARVRISGFRGIKEADIMLGKTSVLIGPNNVGKTTIIEALALILGRDGMIRNLTEHDFYGSAPKASDRIRIIATILGFSDQVPSHNPEWFRRGRGIPKWYDATTGTESALQRDPPFELACDIGFQARFDLGSLEVETLRYFYDDPTNDDVFVEDAVTPVPIGLVRDIGFFLIPATRVWDRMISFGSELFRRVVSSDSGLPAESILAERNRLREPDMALEQDQRLKPIIDEVNKEVVSLFGEGNEIHLRVTATDSSSVLDAVVPHFGSAGAVIPSKRQGSGLLSLQSLFLLLHFGKRRVEGGRGFCLALEEPELHLPPSLQRKVLQRLRALSSQVIVSTHSPLIAGFSEPTDLLVLSNNAGVVTTAPMLPRKLEANTPNAIRILYQLKRVETAAALMAEAVLIPEGVFDYEWLSLLSRSAELQTDPSHGGMLFSLVFGIIPTQSGAVVETAKRIARSHTRVFALVDGDATGQKYIAKLQAEAELTGLNIVRWPDNWTIEDVICWIIRPASNEIISELNRELALPVTDADDLMARLKNDRKEDPRHLKGDRFAYEAIIRAISEQPDSMSRLASLLDSIAYCGKGQTTPMFTRASANSPLVFQP